MQAKQHKAQLSLVNTMGPPVDLFGSNIKLLSSQNDPPQVPREKELLAAVIAKVGPFADRDKLLYHIRISAGKVHWAVNCYFRSILAAPSPPREDFDSKACQTWHQTAAFNSERPAQAVIPAAIGPPAAVAATSCTQQYSEQVPVSSAFCKPGFCSSSSIGQQHQPQSEQYNQPGETLACKTVAARCRASTPAAAACNVVGLDTLPGSALENVLCLLDLSSLLYAASSCKTLYRAAQSERIWRQLFQQRWGSVLFPTSKHGTHICHSSARSQKAVTPAGAGSFDGSHLTATGPSSAGSSRRAAAATAAAASLQPYPLASAASIDTKRRTVAAGAAAASANKHINSGSGEESVISQCTGNSLTQHTAASNAVTATAIAGAGPVVAAVGAVGPDLQQTCQYTSSSSHLSPCRCSGCTVLPASSPAGSWKLQYKQQYGYQAARRCPKCGAGGVLPVVYGFPSAPLLAGVSQKRLLLGGDHLIESCHVWACSGCRSCYRYFPYGNVQLWLRDDEEQQRLDNARSAACRSRVAAAAEADGDGGVDGVDYGDSNPGGDAAAGLPRYTYEL